MAGLGSLVGPMLGALLYAFGGYRAPFYGIGGFYLSLVIYFLLNTPKKEDGADLVMESDLQEPLFGEQEKK